MTYSHIDSFISCSVGFKKIFKVSNTVLVTFINKMAYLKNIKSELKKIDIIVKRNILLYAPAVARNLAELSITYFQAM